MPSKLGLHWQRTHPDDNRDASNFNRGKPKSVKIITDGDHVNGANVVPPETYLIVRHHPLSENWGNRGITDETHAREMAHQHASVVRTLSEWLRVNVPERDPAMTAYTGLNEGEIWEEHGGREPPHLYAIYYAQFLEDLHAIN
jgi:hypothetical protein